MAKLKPPYLFNAAAIQAANNATMASRDLSLRAAADEIRCDHTKLARIRNGRIKPTTEVYLRIQAWLAKQAPPEKGRLRSAPTSDADEPPKTSSRQINDRQTFHLHRWPSHQRDRRRCILEGPQGERGSAPYELVEARRLDRCGAAARQPVVGDPPVRARLLSPANKGVSSLTRTTPQFLSASAPVARDNRQNLIQLQPRLKKGSAAIAAQVGCSTRPAAPAGPAPGAAHDPAHPKIAAAIMWPMIQHRSEKRQQRKVVITDKSALLWMYCKEIAPYRDSGVYQERR